MKEHDFAKYLRKNPAPPVEPVPLPRLGRYVVIPACDEMQTLPAVIASLAAAPGITGTAVLVVANHPAGAPAGIAAATGELIELLRREKRLPYLHWIVAPELVGGVGAARKLGMDAVIAAGSATSVGQTYLCSLDADSPVEPEYFAMLDRTFRTVPAPDAVTVRVRHQPGETPELETAIRRYERYLDRYAAMLARAGSPYAFHTIGSAFAVSATGYLRAGGMRVRTAGEDFYFLQAVAKTGRIVELDEILVHPAARLSQRVPFGTGPALTRLTAGEPLAELPDAAFGRLAELLAAARIPGNLDTPEALMTGLPETSRNFLTANHFQHDWSRAASQVRGAEAQLAAFHRWFDGLKTLRFLRAVATTE